MKIIYLWISIIAIAGFAGAATLGNAIDVTSTGIVIFGYNVECQNNGGGIFCETQSESTGATELLYYEDPDAAADDFSTGGFGSSEGCSPDSWVSSDLDLTSITWPDSYLPDEKFGSPAFFNSMIAISSGDDPTLHEALQSEGDGINKLARHSVAAILNSAHSEINYPISIIDIISYTQIKYTKSRIFLCRCSSNKQQSRKRNSL